MTAIDPTSVSARWLRPDARLRRRQPGDRRADRLAAASRDAEPSRVPGCARHDDVARWPRCSATFLGTNQINLDIHGFDPNGPAGNLNAVRHFATADDLRDRGRQRARLGRPPLPLLRPRRRRPRLEGRRLRPPARLPTCRLAVRLTAKLSQSGHATSTPPTALRLWARFVMNSWIDDGIALSIVPAKSQLHLLVTPRSA